MFFEMKSVFYESSELSVNTLCFQAGRVGVMRMRSESKVRIKNLIILLTA
jgi:hypothetical protein